uniref:Maestro heat-like repeat-containing protein family member 2A n=1 Tax=Mustela putorius furo TaxID=9669 RepID=M3XT87_MUSPF
MLTMGANPHPVEAWGGEKAHYLTPLLLSGNKMPGTAQLGAGPHWSLGAPQVLMSSPYKGEGRGIAMLNLLRTLRQSIAPSMADMWELEIPLLVKYLEEHTEFTWNQKTWEDKLIQFLRNSLKKTRGSNWSLRLSKELNNQIESFDSPSLEKVCAQCQDR